MKKLSDFPNYVSTKATNEEVARQLATVRARQSEIGEELRRGALPSSALARFQADKFDSQPIELRDELQKLEKREQFLVSANQESLAALDAARGVASNIICKEVRPQFIEQIRRILRGLREVTDANTQLDQMRYEIDSAGVRTDSIPHCRFTAVDAWDNPSGGSVTFFRRYIAEQFPELKVETK